MEEAKNLCCTESDIKFVYVDGYKSILKLARNLDSKYGKYKSSFGKKFRCDEYLHELVGEYRWLTNNTHAEIMALCYSVSAALRRGGGA